MRARHFAVREGGPRIACTQEISQAQRPTFRNVGHFLVECIFYPLGYTRQRRRTLAAKGLHIGRDRPGHHGTQLSSIMTVSQRAR